MSTDNINSRLKIVSMSLEPQRIIERWKFTQQAAYVMRRLRIVVHTDRGNCDAEKLRKRRVFYHEGGWGSRITYGYNVEPWDNESYTSIIVTLERFLDGNYWLAEIGLTGWYAMDVYADDELALSKPQTGYMPNTILNTLGKPTSSYILVKLEVPAIPRPNLLLGSRAIPP